MENRELTADDMAADLLYFREAPGGATFKKWTAGGDIYATDRYTLVIEFTAYSSEWLYIIGYEERALFSPPEMEVAGMDKWENQVGTGPFMFKEYVVGSHMTYERNPNYWKTTTIDGVEYELPFYDEIVWPIIPDVATQMAALRTGELDIHYIMPVEQWENMEETASGILSSKYTAARGVGCFLRCNEPPFDDVEVRRAMMVGTDMKAFGDMHGVGSLPIHWAPLWPGHPETLYTPLEDLPASVQLLFDYNPTLAKQMLADAGHPDGFKVQLNVGATVQWQDMMALLAAQWAEIGVEAEIVVRDAAGNTKVKYAQTYHGGLAQNWETGNPIALLSRFESTTTMNFSAWYDDYFDEQIGLMTSTVLSPAEEASIGKALAVYMLGEVPAIPLSATPEAVYWWPWVKNYYAETNVADRSFGMVFAGYTWLDQDLKAEMGY